jgi:NRPS condensation-like uncharacterized protein
MSYNETTKDELDDQRKNKKAEIPVGRIKKLIRYYRNKEMTIGDLIHALERAINEAESASEAVQK